MVLMMVWQWKPAIKEKSKIQHIKKEWNHLTLKTHCKNKELIYCISGRNASEKELDLQINWYWINMRYSPVQEKKVGKNSSSGVPVLRDLVMPETQHIWYSKRAPPRKIINIKWFRLPWSWTFRFWTEIASLMLMDFQCTSFCLRLWGRKGRGKSTVWPNEVNLF